ncbi:MAG: type II toxin-antitoxin system VapC family toxin [Planctomycetales bacterium]|nr:type II toxin-antitoxin system VapC family toxin [Planctomycetales bacterium]
MRLLLDTNRYGDVVNRDREVIERLQVATEVWLPLVALGEIRTGFALGSRRSANERRLAEFLQFQGVGVLLPDEETARHYAEIAADLRRRGSPIPTNDIWIAAAALQHNLTLDTRDEHFRKVSGLKLWRD